MTKLGTDLSIRDLLRAVASAEEAHGAVSVSAVSGAFGTSLILMAAALPQTRSGSAQDRARLVEASVALTEIQEQLLETAETETAVKVFAARNMPQASAAERSDRQAAIQLALRAAADVPLEVMRLSATGLKQARVVAVHSSRAASADVHLGTSLLQAAFDGARSNLEGKLTSLTDTEHVTSVVDEIARLSEEVATTTRATEALLRVPPV
jgi:formiminotetrahydrofolate cyclodeaminase